MKTDKIKGLLACCLLKTAGRKEMSALKTASTFPRVSQNWTLRAILEKAKDSEYGREHHFDEILAARNPDDLYALWDRYNKASDYEDYRPYVERMMHGEADVLFAGKPALYATTSGSSGSPKFVPISKTYMENVYGRMTRLWCLNFVRLKKYCFSGSVFVIVGKQKEDVAPDGTTIGSVSAFTRGNAPQFIREMFPIPQQVYDIEDYAARNYALVRIAIEKQVTLWITPNPSTILELQNNVDKYLDDIIDDIGNGTLSDKFNIPADVRAALEKKFSPNPRRAFELRALQDQYDQVLPRHYWPSLQLLSTWKCGNTYIYLKKMSNYFRYDVVHQELGYFATECRFGLVLDDTNETVLMPHMHFYEFKRERDLDDPDAPFYRLWELKEGERYCPFVTTFSGLYRYNMNDVVQVASNFLNTPRMHMVRKVNGIVSITGEKLYEEQFIMAVDKAQNDTGMKLSYYSGYVNLQESRYDWYFEFEDRKVDQKKADAFAKIVDENLKKLNIEYESKRSSFRLKDPAVYLLQKNAFDKFKEFILNRTHRDASRFKPNVLAQNEDNHKVIHALREKIETYRSTKRSKNK